MAVTCSPVFAYLSTVSGSTWIVSTTQPPVGGFSAVRFSNSDPVNYSAIYPPYSGVTVGAACPETAAMVMMPRDEYDVLRSYMNNAQVSTSDVAQLTSAVLLVWAVAWLCKRAVRILIPNA